MISRRPIHIMTIRAALPGQGKSGPARPELRPTLPMAEAASNSAISSETFGPAALIASVLGVRASLVVVLAAGIVSGLLDDFVVPVMYLRGRRVLAAWGVFWRQLGRGHVGPILLFYLMKIVLGMAVAAVAMIATCLTCCLTALPYLGTVILLPVFVFMRCYSLAFIEQYGPDWRVFAYDLAPPAPSTPDSQRGEGVSE